MDDGGGTTAGLSYALVKKQWAQGKIDSIILPTFNSIAVFVTYYRSISGLFIMQRVMI